MSSKEPFLPERVLQLRNGALVHVRPIRPNDSQGLVRFHEGLSADTIHMRYFSAHPHLNTVEVARLTTVDHHDREAVVALVDDEIVGVARYEKTRTPYEAEAAFVIADAWQGKGLGGHLLRWLVEAARACGFRTLTASTLAHNKAMLAVLLRAGLPVHKHHESGVVDVVLSLE